MARVVFAKLALSYLPVCHIPCVYDMSLSQEVNAPCSGGISPPEPPSNSLPHLERALCQAVGTAQAMVQLATRMLTQLVSALFLVVSTYCTSRAFPQANFRVQLEQPDSGHQEQFTGNTGSSSTSSVLAEEMKEYSIKQEDSLRLISERMAACGLDRYDTPAPTRDHNRVKNTRARAAYNDVEAGDIVITKYHGNQRVRRSRVLPVAGTDPRE